ncbi:hypothetical protein ALC53_12324, partial [Atta colombica]
ILSQGSMFSVNIKMKIEDVIKRATRIKVGNIPFVREQQFFRCNYLYEPSVFNEANVLASIVGKEENNAVAIL